MLQTWNAKNITSEAVQVRPILTLAHPPSKWVLDDGADAVHACRVLLARCDDEAAWAFAQAGRNSASWTASFAAWRHGVGGHGGEDDCGDGNNGGSSGDGDARGCIAKAERCNGDV